VPMDEALGFCSIDISGRAFLVFNASFISNSIGEMKTQMVEEFFRAICYNAKITCHIDVKYGSNDHHICEAIFKAFAHSFKLAIKQENETILSTKGLI
ncbi:MAG: imidazoleglycerol-phosphate dehydratase, partial [Oscillospiraceae bacterium]